VTAKLALLLGSMRAGGARLGVRDLITAHRALAGVNASDREEARLALRAVLCKQPSHRDLFAAAFDATFGEAAERGPTRPTRLARPPRRRGDHS
jgi:uncharacterized protein